MIEEEPAAAPAARRRSLLGRKLRPTEQLLGDPGFPYHAARLIGAAEMASYWMSLSDDPHTKAMGERLEAIAGWFFESSA